MNKDIRYGGLDGLRAYSAIGIVLMHVLVNGAYDLSGFVFDSLIPSFTDLVFLFMVISSFSMCCGYCEKIRNGQMELGSFYARRFQKVLPFFALLSFVEWVVSPSLGSAYEVLANLTLCFGFIPNADIGIIGVGWFLGLVFVFYFLFPFFCSLLANRKRAWLAFAVSVLLHLLCRVYFETTRVSIAYSGVFFMAGGMLYLYREWISRFASRFGWLLIAGFVLTMTAYYLLQKEVLVLVVAFSLLVACAMIPLRRKNTLLSNPFTKWLSAISMEIYLCHMMGYRVLEKLQCIRLFPWEWLSYCVTALATIVGAVIVSFVFNRGLSWLGGWIKKHNAGGKQNA